MLAYCLKGRSSEAPEQFTDFLRGDFDILQNLGMISAMKAMFLW